MEWRRQILDSDRHKGIESDRPISGSIVDAIGKRLDGVKGGLTRAFAIPIAFSILMTALLNTNTHENIYFQPSTPGGQPTEGASKNADEHKRGLIDRVWKIFGHNKEEARKALEEMGIQYEQQGE